MPQALKSCPKSNISPNLVTLTPLFNPSSTCISVRILQCDTICQNFATLVIFIKSLATFEGLFRFFQNFEPTLAQILFHWPNVQSCKRLNIDHNILSSGHTVCMSLSMCLCHLISLFPLLYFTSIWMSFTSKACFSFLFTLTSILFSLSVFL